MLSYSYDSPPEQIELLNTLNAVFVAYYVLEQLLMLLAFSWSHFLPMDHGRRRIAFDNVLDFAITAISLLDITALRDTQSLGLNALRSFRVLRLLHLFPSIRSILVAAKASLTTMFGCFGVFFVFVLVYAMIGSGLPPPHISHAAVAPLICSCRLRAGMFLGVKQGEGFRRGSSLDTPTDALLLLLRAASGEDWHTVMTEAAIEPPFCTPKSDLSDGDCGTPWSFAYFISFALLSQARFRIRSSARGTPCPPRGARRPETARFIRSISSRR
jgi:hypothetical protein